MFYELANSMLFELNASNTAIFPQGSTAFCDPALVSEGSVALETRLVREDATITQRVGSCQDPPRSDPYAVEPNCFVLSCYSAMAGIRMAFHNAMGTRETWAFGSAFQPGITTG